MNKLNQGLSFVVPIYNESASVVDTLTRLERVLSSLDIPFEILAVNDGSKDNSMEKLQSCGLDSVRVLSHPINIGYGNTLKKGIQNAQYPWVGIVDADGTYNIEGIPELVAEAEKGFDMVVASRSNISDLDRFFKRIFRGLLKFTLKRLVHKRIEDPNSGLRLFRRDLVLPLFPFLCGTFSFTTSLTIFFFKLDYLVGYLPMTYAVREGKSKVNHLRDSFITLWMISQGITFFSPLKAFMLLGFGFAFAVCIPSMFLALLKMHTLSLYLMIFGSVFLILIAVGVIGDIIRISTLSPHIHAKGGQTDQQELD